MLCTSEVRDLVLCFNEVYYIEWTDIADAVHSANYTMLTVTCCQLCVIRT